MNLSYDIVCFFLNYFKEIFKYFGCLVVYIMLVFDFYLYKV